MGAPTRKYPAEGGHACAPARSEFLRRHSSPPVRGRHARRDDIASGRSVSPLEEGRSWRLHTSRTVPGKVTCDRGCRTETLRMNAEAQAAAHGERGGRRPRPRAAARCHRRPRRIRRRRGQARGTRQSREPPAVGKLGTRNSLIPWMQRNYIMVANKKGRCRSCTRAPTSMR